MPAPVVEAMKAYLDLEAAIGGYEAAAQEQRRLDGVYDSIARLLNARRHEIALMENATVAWQMAFYSLAFAPGDRILTAEAEYAANYVAFLQRARRTGVVVDVVPSDATGELDVAALAQPLSYLYYNHLAPEALRVRALPEHFQRMDLLPVEEVDRKAAMVATPALIKAFAPS